MASSIIIGSFYILTICSLWANCDAQLAFHTDPQSNSFTLKTPGLQQTFTRYFGGQQGNLLDQTQAQATQQHQQFAPAPQNYYQPDLQQAFPNAYQQQQPQAQATQQQPQYISAQEYAAYLQQSQVQQQAQQQQQFAATRQVAQYAHPSEPQSAAQTASPAAVNNLLGVAYSPSNQVSHVKFSSGDLAYNF